MMTSSNGRIFRVTGPLCGNSPVTGEFPSQRPVTRSFDVFFDLRLNKRLSKQSWGWWFETPSRPLWRQCNVTQNSVLLYIITVGELRSAFMYDPKCSTTFPWCTTNAPAVFAWCTSQFVHKVELSYIEWNGVHTLWQWSQQKITLLGRGWALIKRTSFYKSIPPCLLCLFW